MIVLSCCVMPLSMLTTDAYKEEYYNIYGGYYYLVGGLV